MNKGLDHEALERFVWIWEHTQIKSSVPADFPAEMIRHAIAAFESNRDAFSDLMVRALRAAGRADEADRVEAKARELKN